MKISNKDLKIIIYALQYCAENNQFKDKMRDVYSKIINNK